MSKLKDTVYDRDSYLLIDMTKTVMLSCMTGKLDPVFQVLVPNLLFRRRQDNQEPIAMVSEAPIVYVLLLVSILHRANPSAIGLWMLLNVLNWSCVNNTIRK